MRATVVLAWVVFWLNTALFACCQVYAAAAEKNGGVFLEQATHDPYSQVHDQAHQIDHDPYPPCGNFVSSSVAAASPVGYLVANFSSFEFVVPAVAAHSFPVALIAANKLIPHENLPPVRLYLRELNLRL